MAVKYLDNAGTQYLVNKIKAIDGKIPTESQITTMITTALNTYKEGIVTIVESLPQTGEEGKLYLMVDPSDSDVYIVYTWEDNAFKRMGSKTFTLTVDSALSDTSTNPVQNKVIKSALDGKANSSHTHGSITNDGKLGTASRVVITGTDKKIGISTVTTTQLGYLSGVTSAIQTQLDGKSPTGHTHTAGDVAGLSTVATTGSYNDLSDKPAINNATLTIQRNGTTVKTFTANASSNVTANITVPTKTSDLTNDSNFVDTSNSAVASGITSAKVTSYDSHVADTDIHVTTADKTKWNNGVSQSYVLRYSSASVTNNSTIAYSTLDNTDNIKASDKVIDVDGKIFSIVSVDTANQTVTVGTALIDLALDANVVHTSGAETISGTKAFSATPYIYNSDSTENAPNMLFRNSKYSVGDTTDTGEQRIIYADKNGAWTGSISSSKNIAGTQYLTFTIYSTDNNNANISSTINYYLAKNGDRYFTPYEDNLISLGSTTRRWKVICATNYYYGSNNVEFSTKFVTTDTNQTITGTKTFTDLLIYNSDTTAYASYLNLKNQRNARGSSETGVQGIQYQDKNGKSLTMLESRVISNGNTGFNILCYNTDGNNQSVSDGVSVIKSPTTTTFTPITDNAVTCGRTLAKWSDVQTYKVNNLAPSSLSLPDIANKIDISSYVSDLTGVNNEYTPTVNGWICVRSGNATKISILDSATNIGNQSVSSTATYLTVMAPCIANKKVYINIVCTSLSYAYFIPCQGNV